MIKIRNTLFALIAPLVLALLLPSGAYAQEAGALACQPAAGTAVNIGDIIQYTFTAAAGWEPADGAALRVRLQGLSLLSDSVAASVKNGTAKKPGYTLVQGNDGFVLLLSKVTPGDTVSFSAAVTGEAEVEAEVTYGAFSSKADHALIWPATVSSLTASPSSAPAKVTSAAATPSTLTPAALPIASPSAGTHNGAALRWTIAAVVLTLFLGVGCLLFRRLRRGSMIAAVTLCEAPEERAPQSDTPDTPDAPQTGTQTDQAP